MSGVGKREDAGRKATRRLAQEEFDAIVQAQSGILCPMFGTGQRRRLGS
jgi:hypothetical protein